MQLFQSSSTGKREEVEWNGLCSFGRGSHKEYSCIIISKSIHWLRQKSRLKVFLFFALEAILFRGVEGFEQFW